MVKVGGRAGSFFVLTVWLLAWAAPLTGCSWMPGQLADREQADQLNALVRGYHLCVAAFASTMDDGETPIAEISTAALGVCRSRAEAMWTYLGSIAMPDATRTRFIENQLQIAASQSTAMLRRRRYPEWEGNRI
jgi:hypothetical protein